MKQRITLFWASTALFMLCSTHNIAQNLMKEGFDTTTAYVFGNFHSWTDSIYNTSGCCGPVKHWFVGPSTSTVATYGSLSYTSYSTIGYSEWYPNASTHSGNGYALLNTTYMLYSYSYQGIVELRSPPVTLPSTGKSVVSYWVFLNYAFYGNYNYYYDSFQVWVNTGPRSFGTNALKLREVIIDSLTSSAYNGWVKYTDTIPTSYNGQSVNIMFKGFSQYYYYGGDITIDDFSVDHYFDCSASPGGPHCGMPAGPTHICRNKAFTITDTGGTSYVGYNYQWQSRPTGTTTWSNAGTGNPLNTSIATGQNNTDYRVYMTCSSTGYTDTSNVWTVVADSFFRCYCAVPTTNTTLGGNTPPTVDSVAIAGTSMKNATHLPYPGFYTEIIDSVTKTHATVSRGGTYSLYTSYGGSTSYGMAWIDWNQSGVYNDSASAEYYPLNSTLQGSGRITFTVPTTARIGRTGLRVRSTSIYSPNSSYPCTNFGTGTGAGETVDYIITVTNPLTVDLGVTSITAPPLGATYCPNKADTVSVTIQNYGSTPQSNFYIYAISNGPHTDTIYTLYTGTLAPLATANVQIGTIDPPLGGSYSLQAFTVAAGDGAPFNDTLYSYYNLNALPPDPTVTSDTVCPGGTAHISVSPLRYEQMKWYRAPTGGAAFDSTSYTRAVVAPAGDSTYYISATDSGTKCIGNRIPVTATMRPKPIVNLGNDSTLCESPKFILHAGNFGGSKYLWNTGDTTESINPRTTGTYSVNVFHYCTVVDSVHLVINPLPKADGIDYVRTANTYSYGIAGVLYTNSYKWYFGDGDSSTNPNPVHTYTTGGPYHVTVVLYNACGADTVTWGVPNKVKNIGQQNGNLSLYPNPASDKLVLSAGDNTTITQVMIVNAIGSVIYSRDMNNEKSLSIDVSMLPQGQYILRANTNQGMSTKLFDVLHK